MKNETEDITLIKDILEGDQEAQRIFYDKYRTILSDYIASKYPNNYELEDDISEILIKIFTNLYKYDEEKAQVKTWAFAIAKNYMIDKSRCNIPLSGTITIEGNPTISFYDGVVTSDTTQFDPNDPNVFFTNSSYVADFESCDAVNFVSNNISNCDYALLDMKYKQGFNYNEIATEFNLTSNTVSNRVNYIKGKIKTCLAEEFEE